MNTVKRLFLFLCIAVFLLSGAVNAYALTTSDPKEPFDPTKPSELHIEYTNEDVVLPGRTISLYYVATVSTDYVYTPIGAFAGREDIVINGIQTEKQWRKLEETLSALITAENIEPYATAVTDENGIATFSGLMPGIYFIDAYVFYEGNWKYTFKRVTAHIPQLTEDGHWNYDVTLHPKFGKETIPDDDEDETYTVTKLWVDNGHTEYRTKEVNVTIYKNGDVYEKVGLKGENDWTYSWTVKKDGSDWKVMEDPVPEHYTVTVEQKKNAFIVTNTLKDTPPDPPHPPKTGESNSYYLSIVLMALSGAGLLALGFVGLKRKERRNEA